MNLTEVWSKDGYPEASAIYEAVLICPKSITAPNNPPWPANKFYCSLAGGGVPDPFWPIAPELFVLAVADGQAGATVQVYPTLAAAQAGSGRIAEYTGPVFQFASPQAEDAALEQVGAGAPNLEGYHIGFRPRTDGANPLWSVYKTASAATTPKELQVCDAIVAVLQGRTGEGESLSGVEVISCGPKEDTLPPGRDSIRVTVEAPRRSEDVAQIGRRHIMLPVSIRVTVMGLLDSPVAWKRCRALVAAVSSILTDEDRSVAFRVRTITARAPEPVGAELLAYAGDLELEVDLLTEMGG